MADGEPVTPARAGRAHRVPRALPARVALPAGGQRLRRATTRRRTASGSRRAGDGAGRRRQPGVHPGRLPAAGGDGQGRAAHHRALPLRRGLGWHEHDHDLFEGTERFFRPGYLANLVDGVAAGARRRRRASSQRGRARRRHRLRARRLDDPDGEGLPRLDVRRLRLPRGLDRGGAPRRRARRRRRPRDVRGRLGARTSAAARTTSCACSTRCTTWAIPVGAARHVALAARPTTAPG